MTVDEYKARVIAHFKSGDATDEQWEELAQAVLVVSESGESYLVEAIDDAIGRPEYEGDDDA